MYVCIALVVFSIGECGNLVIYPLRELRSELGSSGCNDNNPRAVISKRPEMERPYDGPNNNGIFRCVHNNILDSHGPSLQSSILASLLLFELHCVLSSMIRAQCVWTMECPPTENNSSCTHTSKTGTKPEVTFSDPSIFELFPSTGHYFSRISSAFLFSNHKNTYSSHRYKAAVGCSIMSLSEQNCANKIRDAADQTDGAADAGHPHKKPRVDDPVSRRCYSSRARFSVLLEELHFTDFFCVTIHESFVQRHPLLTGSLFCLLFFHSIGFPPSLLSDHDHYSSCQ